MACMHQDIKSFERWKHTISLYCQHEVEDELGIDNLIYIFLHTNEQEKIYIEMSIDSKYCDMKHRTRIIDNHCLYS